MRRILQLSFGLLITILASSSTASERTAVAEKRENFVATFTDEDRDWWCFQPLKDPPVPKVPLPEGANPLDAFVIARLQTNGLHLAPAASSPTLIRRASFDLTGLPPTPEDIAVFNTAFTRDPKAAIDNLVNRLLTSPHYGEHWAQYWLDLVRYAESDGYKKDDFRPYVYQYRDYVIQSLNGDKPYDRFVIEQLAGDEVDPGNRDALVATMFLRHWIYEYNQRDVEFQWQAILSDITETTGDVFLGLGMECARCHDHKFDPILRRDYYRLQAFFAALLPREDQPLGDLVQRAKYHERLNAWTVATESIRQRLHEIEDRILLERSGGEAFQKFVPEIKTLIRKRAVDRKPYEHQIAMMASRQFTIDRSKLSEWIEGKQKTEWKSLHKQLAGLESLRPPPLPTIPFVVSDVGLVAPTTLIPDDLEKSPVQPGFLTLLDPNSATVIQPHAALQSTGRRTALARWIASPDNPLTARVIVNRIWQHHFGRGLVDTPSDFGRLGNLPSHPKLLDWLAHRFINGGWRLKPLHRLIMTSATYRQASSNRDRSKQNLGSAIDPHAIDRLLWQVKPRRLRAEQVRDAALAISGELNPQMGGISVGWDQPRRAIYTKIMRNQIEPLLTILDAPDTIRSTDRRNVTTTANQALLMFNGDWLLERAAAMARRLSNEMGGGPKEWVQGGFLLALGRLPSPEELGESVAFLNNGDASTVLADFCHVLLNSNEMLYID